ncbi:MAG: hypothetical protein AAGG68_25345 [Bacteroidota bacterium]
MSKSNEKKSMIELMDNQEPIVPNIEKAVKSIHQSQKEKLVKFSIATPESLHKELKKIAIDEGIDLRRFFLQAALEKCERLNHSLKEAYPDFL